MSTPLDLYLRALDGFTSVVDQVPNGVWDAPTPCPDWSARQLLGHVIDVQRQVVGMLNGLGTTPIIDAAELAVPDPHARWKRSRAETVAVLSGVDLAAAVHTPGGPSTGSAVLGMVVIEPLVHAWDLATSTGQAVELDPEIVRAVLPGVVAAGVQLADTGMYRPAIQVPAEAPAQFRLLGALGRRGEQRATPGALAAFAAATVDLSDPEVMDAAWR